ncbi:MAG: protein arginine kinase, partial [Candidatus Hydrogenedentes bacterium]|nr:protein arginine kinase [Candidatus Hydrogenedentota bacterium]
YGYLSSDLAHTGTALKASVILHLPALTMTGSLDKAAQLAKDRRQALSGLKATGGIEVRLDHTGEPVDPGRASQVATVTTEVSGEALYSHWYDVPSMPYDEAQGDLCVLFNTSTLDISEEETIFHLKHVAEAIVKLEQDARRCLQRDNPIHIEDRVARAFSLGRNVRLLGFAEALELLSSIRLGVATGIDTEHSIQSINELLVASQNVHIQMRTGHDSGELGLSARRADLFRAQLS